MPISRAGFLKVCGTAIIGGLLPAWRLSGASPAVIPVPGSATSASLFHPLVGTMFAIHGMAAPVRLTRVTEQPLHDHIEQFSLLFEAAPGAPLPDGTYMFSHAALGELEMFITPAGAPAAAPVHQACFSRVVSKEGAWPIRS